MFLLLKAMFFSFSDYIFDREENLVEYKIERDGFNRLKYYVYYRPLLKSHTKLCTFLFGNEWSLIEREKEFYTIESFYNFCKEHKTVGDVRRYKNDTFYYNPLKEIK